MLITQSTLSDNLKHRTSKSSRILWYFKYLIARSEPHSTLNLLIGLLLAGGFCYVSSCIPENLNIKAGIHVNRSEI